MKVLENNYEKSTGRNAVRKIVCDHCRSVLEIDESDVDYGAYGLPQITCPCCGKMIDDTGDTPAETLTAENLIFPKHFHHVSKESGAADCFERNVLKTIREQVDFLRHHPEESCCGGWISGNLMSIVVRYDGDEQFVVLVSNDFYETAIPFNENDMSDMRRRSCN